MILGAARLSGRALIGVVHRYALEPDGSANALLVGHSFGGRTGEGGSSALMIYNVYPDYQRKQRDKRSTFKPVQRL
ncbi:hypothetical protein YSA_11053 [Pseudomonas putida ND6]|uniref:Uncharacterized protein n=1 Tax=Pseudomonas putida ND6 TaxID=231023 RepID=I3V4U0_PSEPU|nr:hypothetical protein YSA_11053 [Pseudomonas putida ND6]